MAKMLGEAERRATEVVAKHEDRIRALIDRLEHEETLDREGIEACLATDAKPGPLRALADK